MIAQDAISYGIQTTTSLVISHTCSGSNRILIVTAYTHGSTDDRVTGVTYAGVAMTRINTITNAGGGNTASRSYLYYLIAPATGANDIVISISPSTLTLSVNVSFTGTKQSGQPDANNTQFGNQVYNLTTNLTTIADNSWIVGMTRVHSGTPSVPEGTTEIFPHGTIGIGFYRDTDSPITPPGSGGIGITTNSIADILQVIASIAPFPEPPVIKDKFFLMF